MHEKEQFGGQVSMSNDSLECVSDNGGDSLDSSIPSEDSLQIMDDSLGESSFETINLNIKMD